MRVKMNDTEKDFHRAVLKANEAFRNYLEGEGYDPSFYRLILTAERSTEIDYKPVYRLSIDFNPQDEIPPIRYKKQNIEVLEEE